MKKFLNLIAFCFFPFILISQDGTGYLEGNIKDSISQQGLAGVFIRVYNINYTDTSAYTDANGDYNFELSAPQIGFWKYYINIDTSGYFPIFDSVNISIGSTEVRNFALLKQLGGFQGKVLLDSDYGNPENVLLEIDNDDYYKSSYPTEEGVYVFDSVPFGTYGFKASMAGYHTVETTVEINDSVYFSMPDILLEVLRGMISGEIKVMDQGQLSEVRVRLIRDGDTLSSTQPQEEGYYSFDTLKPGNYVIRADLTDFHSDPESFYLVLVPDANIDTINFSLYKNRSVIRGFVFDSFTNDPVEAALVQIIDTMQAVTDEEGYYIIDSITTSHFNVQISKPDYFDLNVPVSLTLGDTVERDYQLIHRPVISTSPDTIEFGYLPPLTASRIMSYDVYAIYLTDILYISTGDPDHFLISLDSTADYQQNLYISPLSMGLIDTAIFVKFRPDATGEFTGKINHISTGFPDKEIGLHGFRVDQLTTSIEADAGIICKNELMNLMSNTAGGAEDEPYIYQWSLNGDSISDQKDLTGFQIMQTSNLFKFQVTDASGQLAVDSVTVETYPEIQITGHPVGDTICANEPSIFEISLSSTTEIDSYRWEALVSSSWIPIYDNDLYDGTSTTRLYINMQEKEIFGAGTKFRCKVNRCQATTSDDADLVIFDIPWDTLCFKGIPDIAILVSPDSGQVYQWYKNDSLIKGADKQFYYSPVGYINESDEYYVKITNERGCTTESIHFTGSQVLKLLNSLNREEPVLMISPNPFTDRIYLLNPGDKLMHNINVKISDISGKHVHALNSMVIEPGKQVFIEAGHLASGIYFLIISGEEISMSIKIFKK